MWSGGEGLSRPGLGSLAEYLEQLSNELPEKKIFSWLNHNGDVAASFTRQELWDRSRALAVYLKGKCGLNAGDRVMVVFPFGIEFIVGFIACQLIGAIVVSVYPPNPNKFKTDIPKFNHFVNNSGCNLALTTKSYKRVVKVSKLAHSNWPSHLVWVAIDGISSTLDTAVEIRHKPALTDIALIQYTSGSTSAPKGVMVTNGNILYQLEFLSAGIRSQGSTSEGMVFVSWAPQYHDLGLMGTFLLPMYCGGHSLAMSPLDFLSNPILWPYCLERYDATVTSAPNFGFALTCKRLETAGETFNCHTMKAAVMGAEPSDITLLPRIEQFMGIAPKYVVNSYGLAENTLMATTQGSRTLLHEATRWSAGCLRFSREVGGVTIVIVGKDGHPVKDGTQGEVWISGPCVAKGYYEQPELTRETFENHLPAFPGKTFLRSGDVGVIEHGQLYICSRIKDLIIINGRNIAPNDVEKCAENAFPEYIRPGSTVAFQSGTEGTSVVLVLELRAEAKTKISIERLADMIHALVEKNEGITISDLLLVPKGTVPKTTSGKVQRRKTKTLWEEKRFQSHTSTAGNKLENCASFEQLLENAGVVDWNLTLAENGIDSLKLVNLVQEASRQFGYPLRFEDASIKPCLEILNEFKEAGQQSPPSIFLASPAWSKEDEQVPGPAKILLSQLFVVVVLFGLILVSTVPASLYIDHCWDYNSSLWVINGRAGPFVGVAFIIWCLAYTIVCVCASGCFLAVKWMDKAFKDGHFISPDGGLYSDL